MFRAVLIMSLAWLEFFVSMVAGATTGDCGSLIDRVLRDVLRSHRPEAQVPIALLTSQWNGPAWFDRLPGRGVLLENDLMIDTQIASAILLFHGQGYVDRGHVAVILNLWHRIYPGRPFSREAFLQAMSQENRIVLLPQVRGELMPLDVLPRPSGIRFTRFTGSIDNFRQTETVEALGRISVGQTRGSDGQGDQRLIAQAMLSAPRGGGGDPYVYDRGRWYFSTSVPSIARM